MPDQNQSTTPPPWNWQENHERRISAMESQLRQHNSDVMRLESKVDRAAEAAATLRKDILGDASRFDAARVGALEMLRQSLEGKLDAQTREIAAIVEEKQGRSATISSRRWNVFSIGLAAILGFGTYLVLHFLPPVH